MGTPAESPRHDVWFYSNPIFLEVERRLRATPTDPPAGSVTSNAKVGRPVST